jgi:pyruvate/2-oxoglutarate dehydrogenase complex dihydrolipoamide dehydrogenase (E3) component
MWEEAALIMVERRLKPSQVRERKQKVVERFRNGAEQVLEATANLDVIRGQASFIDARTVKVEGAGSEALRLSAEKIFISTGAKPVIPPIDGLSRVPSLDSASIMERTRCRNIS